MDGLVPVVVASIVISFGLGPVFGLTTELVVGSAPPEKAGAASGISETATELGGSLGIAILGSIGVAMYRSTMLGEAPAGVPGGRPGCGAGHPGWRGGCRRPAATGAG